MCALFFKIFSIKDKNLNDAGKNLRHSIFLIRETDQEKKKKNHRKINKSKKRKTENVAKETQREAQHYRTSRPRTHTRVGGPRSRYNSVAIVKKIKKSNNFTQSLFFFLAHRISNIIEREDAIYQIESGDPDEDIRMSNINKKHKQSQPFHFHFHFFSFQTSVCIVQQPRR